MLSKGSVYQLGIISGIVLALWYTASPMNPENNPRNIELRQEAENENVKVISANCIDVNKDNIMDLVFSKADGTKDTLYANEGSYTRLGNLGTSQEINRVYSANQAQNDENKTVADSLEARLRRLGGK